MHSTYNPNSGKRKPRTLGTRGTMPRTRSAEHTSVCVSYREDEHGNKVNGRIFHAARKTASQRIRQARDVRKQRTLELLMLAGNNSDVD